MLASLMQTWLMQASSTQTWWLQASSMRSSSLQASRKSSCSTRQQRAVWSPTSQQVSFVICSRLCSPRRAQAWQTPSRLVSPQSSRLERVPIWPWRQAWRRPSTVLSSWPRNVSLSLRARGTTAVRTHCRDRRVTRSLPCVKANPTLETARKRRKTRAKHAAIVRRRAQRRAASDRSQRMRATSVRRSASLSARLG